MTDADLDLARRTALPDALRVLLSDYPRSGWQGHPRFDGLVRFWLDRHLMFRRLQEGLTREARAFLDGDAEPRRTGQAIARLGTLYLSELHGHHLIEDEHYFPTLARMEPRLERGFALLDGDHHRLDAELHRLAEAANAALRALSEGDGARVAVRRAAVGRLAATLDGFAPFLDRHLLDEEEIVVPVILAHGPGGIG